MNLSRQQVEDLLKNKPAGVSDQAVIKSLTDRGYQLEGLKLPSKMESVSSPSTVKRVSDTISTAGQQVRQQIMGEGEFAGQSPLVRGTGAAASAATAIPETALQAVPEALGGGYLRRGVEKVGEVVSGAFNRASQALSQTDLIKGAAGATIDGQYVPNDLGFLENALQTASNIGEVSGVTAGAATGPKVAANTAGRTVTAVADVGREALDRTIRASANLAEKATPKSVRTVLRLNPPDTRTRAIAELEDAYKSGLVEDRKAINNKLDKLAASQSFGDTRITRDSLIREIAEEGYIPKIEGSYAKFDEVFDDIETRQRGLMESLDNELAPLSNRIETQTSLDRIREQVEATLRQSPQIGAGLTSSLQELERMFRSFAEKYGPTLSPIEVNDIRKEMNRVTKTYKNEDIFKLDTAEAVAKTARQRLDEVVPSGKVRQLNQEWARLQRVEETARILNNEIVEVGLLGRKLGSYVGTIGASLAGLSLAGPGGLVVASIFAQLGSDALATLLRNKKFDPTLKKTIVDELKADPETTGRLIREASPENKAFLAKLIGTGAALGAAEYFLDDEGAAAAVIIGSTGGRTPITGKALDKIEQYIDHTEGITKVTGQDLIDLKADVQAIAERAGLDPKFLTGGDKQLANGLRQALDIQNATAGKAQSATTKTTDLLEEARKSSDLVRGETILQNNGSEMEFVSKMNTPKGEMFAFRTKGQPEGSFELFPVDEIDELLAKQGDLQMRKTESEKRIVDEKNVAKNAQEQREKNQLVKKEKEANVDSFLNTLPTTEKLNAQKQLKKLVRYNGEVIPVYQQLDIFTSKPGATIKQMTETIGRNKGKKIPVLVAEDGTLLSLDNKGMQLYAEEILKN